MSGKRIFITGGASGLGRALALRYAREGWSVLIGDISEGPMQEALAEISKLASRAHAVRCDVRKEEDLEAAASWLEREWKGVDVVVNNAGVAIAGGIAEQSIADWQWIVDINLMGVVRGCKVFTPLFRRQGGGQFINVASAAGLIHPPLMAAYNATKAAVVALSETLSVELEADKIRVTVVCPSFFRTNLTDSMRTVNPELKNVTNKLMDKASAGADVIADRVFEGASRGQFRVVPNLDAKAAYLFKRMLPYAIYEKGMVRESKRMMGRKVSSTR